MGYQEQKGDAYIIYDGSYVVRKLTIERDAEL